MIGVRPGVRILCERGDYSCSRDLTAVVDYGQYRESGSRGRPCVAWAMFNRDELFGEKCKVKRSEDTNVNTSKAITSLGRL